MCLRLRVCVALDHAVHAHGDCGFADGVDDGGPDAGRGQVRGGEDADGVAGCFAGVDGALDVQDLRELDGLAGLGGYGCAQDVVD